MKKSLWIAVLSLAGLFSVPAHAGSFTGVCTLSGTATLGPPALTAVPQTSTFSFNTDGGATNRCSGLLNGAPVTNVPATANAGGSGTLSCVASAATGGSGTLTINGTVFGISLSIVGTGPQVTLVVQGNGGGAATGQASFATDTGAATKCQAGASSLSFLVAATAANLTN